MWTCYLIPTRLKEQIAKCFNRKHVMTIGEICSKIDRAEITVRKAPIELEYFTSYNFDQGTQTNEYLEWAVELVTQNNFMLPIFPKLPNFDAKGNF